MKNITETIVKSDVLVIGGGMAGVFAAMKARSEGLEVVMVDKGYMSRSGASSANDGDFTVYNEKWGGTVEAWKQEVAVTGEYMNNPEWTEATVRESWDRLQDLISWGIHVDRDENGEIVHKSWHANYHAVRLGWGWSNFALLRKVLLSNGIKIYDRVYITDLLMQDGICSGAVGFHTIEGDFYAFSAKATVLCTGTSGFKGQAPGCFHRASFDGEAMVFRAGGECSGMEFNAMGRWTPYTGDWAPDAKIRSREDAEVDDTYFRYAPYLFGQPNPLMLLGTLTDATGHGDGPFHPYTMATVHQGNGPLLLDLRDYTDEQIDAVKHVYDEKEVLKRMKEIGADPVYAKKTLYSGDFVMSETFMGRSCGGTGGVTSTSMQGGTSLPGLFGGGDSYHSAASGTTYPSGGTGLRVAATSGARAGIGATAFAKERGALEIDMDQVQKLREYTYMPIQRQGGFDPMWVGEQIRSLMIPYYMMGIRKGDRLQAGQTMLDFYYEHLSPRIYARDFHKLAHAHEAKNRIIGAKMMVGSALFREESRGLHYREDFPSRDDFNWRAHVNISNENGKMVFSKLDISDWHPGLTDVPYLERYPKRFLGEDLESK